MGSDEAENLLSQPLTVFLRKPFDMAGMQKAIEQLA
jgi:hypothetical protein